MSERMPLTSQNVLEDRTALLREIFPEVFTEGKIDFERLKQALGQDIDTGRERYGLTWAGKGEAIKTIQALSTGTLKPAPEESVNFDTTKNLIIEGDNLEVLKLMQKSYYGKVKMIYIDPPYNTGNEFIYPDNFREGLQDYLRYSGQIDSNGIRLSTNTEADGRFHSKWLNMIYPRLFLARNLLRDDGAIFISIDDNELSNLKAVMNEIFGEENFVANLVWQKKVSPANDSKWFSGDHEYILVFARNKEIWRPRRLARTEEQEAYYTNPDNDPRGPWNSVAYTCNKSKSERPNLYYPIRNPNTGEEIWPKETAVWAYSKELNEKHAAENLIYWGKDGCSRSPRYKKFLSDAGAVVPRSVLPYSDVGHTQEATSEFFSMFPEGGFSYPKPSRLMERLLLLGTNPTESDIVLDFFAGSGTLAQSVVELNLKDNGNRVFVCVQLPERIDEGPYQNITQVTAERVRRTIKKAELNGHEVSANLGFKYMRLTHSNFKIWDTDQPVPYLSGTENQLKLFASGMADQLRLFADHIVPGSSQFDILYELLLKAGMDLNSKIEKLSVGNQTVFSIADGLLLICLEDEIQKDTLRKMMDLSPQRIVCLDPAFKGNDMLKTNTVLEMEARNIEFRTV